MEYVKEHTHLVSEHLLIFQRRVSRGAMKSTYVDTMQAE